MDDNRWSKVDEYLTTLLVGEDESLDQALAASDGAGLPKISVAPNQGKLLKLLAQMSGAKRILEVGTLGVAEAAMRLDDQPVGGVGVGKVRFR